MDTWPVHVALRAAWAGANMANTVYQPHITSYDYDCTVSESGAYGQPGTGGDNKFEVGALLCGCPPLQATCFVAVMSHLYVAPSACPSLLLCFRTTPLWRSLHNTSPLLLICVHDSVYPRGLKKYNVSVV